jgi:hypothetical protein
MTGADKIKVGDRVWLGRGSFPKSQLRPVVKVTATQIVVAWTPTYSNRFRRDGGYRIGGGMLAEHITGIATKAECLEWDRKKAAAREAADKKKAAEAAIDKRRLELLGAFRSDNIQVAQEQWGTESERAGKWEVEVHYLSEEQVRELAKWLDWNARMK